jgi:2-dehydropantoate 2-reductase
MTAPRVLVLGTGALGTVFAARLARTGIDVTISGVWREALQATAERGLEVTEDGRSWSVPVRPVAREDIAGTFAAVLVLVKSFASALVAPVAARSVAEGGLVLTLQNGMGNLEVLRDAVGARAEVAAGTTTVGATLLGPGRVRAQGGHVLLETGGERRDALAALLQASGFAVERTRDLPAALWRKLAVNCAINPLTALLRIPNGELPGHETAATSRAAAREVQAVAAAAGITSEGDWAEAAMDVARLTSGNHSSMLQDVERGRPTEIDAMCGFVVREGRRHGVATPVNAELHRRVDEMMRGRCAS